MNRLRGSDNAAGREIGQRNRIHIEVSGASIVGVVRIFIDIAVTIRNSDQVGVTGKSNWNIHAVRYRAVFLSRIERRSVAVTADEYVVRRILGVERQIDIVFPLPAGRHRTLVYDGELNRRSASCRDMRRNRKAGNLQIRTILEAHAQYLIVGLGIVGCCRAELIDTRPNVGAHDNLIDALQLRRNDKSFRARIGDARGQTFVIRELSQLNERRSRVVDAPQRNRIHPTTGRARESVVFYSPTNIDSVAFEGSRRRGNVGDYQVRRIGERHVERRTHALIVVRVNEFKRPARSDDDVVVARNTVGQHDVDGTIVGDARADAADVREVTQERAAGPVGIRREIDGIRPTIRAGHADALIEHRPVHAQRLTAQRRPGSHQACYRQIRVWRRYYINRVACCGRIVRFEIVLEDLVVRVRFDEQLEAPRQRGGQQDAFVARVALALRKRAGMHEIANDNVVAVPEHAVRGKNDSIRPARRPACAGALVRYRPTHIDARRIVNGQRRCSHVGHR